MSYTLAINALRSIGDKGIDLAVLHSNRAGEGCTLSMEPKDGVHPHHPPFLPIPPCPGARLMIGKPLGALDDAKMAVELDAKFIRAVVRVSTCHLRLGEFRTARSIVDAVQDRLSPSSQVWNSLL